MVFCGASNGETLRLTGDGDRTGTGATTTGNSICRGETDFLPLSVEVRTGMFDLEMSNDGFDLTCEPPVV